MSEPEPGEHIIELESVVQPGEVSSSVHITEDQCCSCIICACLMLFIAITIVLVVGYTHRE